MALRFNPRYSPVHPGPWTGVNRGVPGAQWDWGIRYRSHTEPLFKSKKILKFEDMYTMQVSLFVYDLNNDLLPKSFRKLLSQNCLARHGIITRQNNLIPQSRSRTTFSSKLPKHNFTRIWNKTVSTLAHGKNKLTLKVGLYFRRRQAPLAPPHDKRVRSISWRGPTGVNVRQCRGKKYKRTRVYSVKKLSDFQDTV